MNINPITIEEICGVNPPGIQYVNPGNNPNFVFTPDVNFEVIPLYDVAGNVINVNSWFECAHYVTGGWSNSLVVEYFEGDKFVFFTALSLSIIYLIYSKISQKVIV
jgi:hypothetical protein